MNTINILNKVEVAANAWYDNYVANSDRPAYVTDEHIESYRMMFVWQLMGENSCKEVHEIIAENWVELGRCYLGVQCYLYHLADAVEAARAAKRAKLEAAAFVCDLPGCDGTHGCTYDSCNALDDDVYADD